MILCAIFIIYGGAYIHQRTHAPLHIDKEVAMRAISLFMESSKNTINPLISFAGGEPFLEYSLIKDAIDFVRNHFDKNVRFFANTNGTLLSEIQLDYLTENNVDLRFSIDGPKDIHDRHRRTRTNAPTYDKVVKCIKYLYREHREYFNKHVSFSVVLSEPSRIDEVFQFFSRNMFKDAEKIFSPVNPYNRKAPYYVHPHLNTNKKVRELYDQYIQLWVSEDNPAKSLFHFSFGKLLLKIHNRSLTKIGDTYSPGDCCIPAVHRLICKVDGKLGFCDKQAFLFDIGDVWNWIDIKKIESIIREYCSISKMLCKDCWAMRFCRSCFSFATDRKNLSIDKLRKVCPSNKISVETALKMYCEIMERNPQAFKRFK